MNATTRTLLLRTTGGVLEGGSLAHARSTHALTSHCRCHGDVVAVRGTDEIRPGTDARAREVKVASS